MISCGLPGCVRGCPPRTCPAQPSRTLYPRRLRGPGRRGFRQAAPTQALFGDLLQRLDPTAANSAWLPWQPATRRAPGRKARLEEDVARVRNLMERCRRERELRLPSLEESGLSSLEQQEAMVVAALHASPSCAASNAVPFSSAAMSEGHLKEGAAPFSSAGTSSCVGAAAAVPRVEAVRPILPCLLAAEGRLDARGTEQLASSLALSQLQLLDFVRVKEGQSRCLPDDVCWCGPGSFPSCRVAAAALLRRMVTRRGGILDQLPDSAGHAIVLVYPPQDRQLAAETVALYLHLYCSFGLEQAAKEATQSMGVRVEPQALLPCLEELALAAEGWRRRVRLVWPYGGGRVELSGDPVGGWDRKVSMAFDVRQRHWVLWFWGLSPGIYRCKFIVDGRWCIDMAAPTEYDSRGNVNNVIAVLEQPQPPGAAPAGAPGAGTGGRGGEGLQEGEQGTTLHLPPRAGEVDGAGPPSHTLLMSEGALLGAVDGAPGGADGAPGVLGLVGVSLQAPPGPAAVSWADGAAAELGAGREEGERAEGSAREGATPSSVGLPDVGQVGERAKFGAALLAFYCKLAVQRRVAGGHL